MQESAPSRRKDSHSPSRCPFPMHGTALDAHGWPHTLTDDQILQRLLALKPERAAGEGKGAQR